ncbi:right-handed parallel beta-helix repeat-containing protein, partial [Streptomyces hydrogenans]
MVRERRHRTVPTAPLVLLLLAATGCTGTPAGPAGTAPASAPGAAAGPVGAKGAVARVCDAPAAGPATAPAGAVTVDPAVVGDLVAKTAAGPPGTTFWLRPGTHTLGPDAYDQVETKEGNRYLGAPGAVLDGRGVNQYAFGGTAAGVTLRYLTVRGFVAPKDEGVVNHDMADGWTVEHTRIEDNSGAGLM